MTELLKTPRLEIKPFSEEDRERLSELLLCEDIKKTYMIPDFATDEELDRMLDSFLCLSRADGRFVRGIYADGALVGFVNDVEIIDGRIELGYVIHPAHWGKGYATEMLGAAIDEMLAQGFSTVRAGAFSENPASMRVMEKCGMQRCTETEIIEYRGESHLCIYYEIKA